MNDQSMNLVISKIKKLLARADAQRNDNSHEREIAMRQATILLAKHGLAMSEVEGAGDAHGFGALGKLEISTGRAARWIPMIYNQIGRLNGCKVLRLPGRGVVLFGRAMRVTVARQMADYVINSICREADLQHSKTPHVHGRKFRTDFGDGAASGVYQQVNDILEAQKRGQLGDDQLSGSMAMVVVNQHKNALAEADRHMRSNYSVRSGSAKQARVSNAFYAGREYGRNVSLNTQVGSSGQRKLR